MTTGTEAYYDRRAHEYDVVYDKPERQTSIAALRDHIVVLLGERSVLELACGTGFWTQWYCLTAARVLATDINGSTLDVARARRHWPDHVAFALCGAFDLEHLHGTFDAAFAGFLWSHIPLDRQHEFLASLLDRVEPGSIIVLADNRYVDGSNHPVVRTDEHGNTYQRRTLGDGTQWEVLKNFPTSEQLEEVLDRHGEHVDVREFDYFWCATLRTPERSNRSVQVPWR